MTKSPRENTIYLYHFVAYLILILNIYRLELVIQATSRISFSECDLGRVHGKNRKVPLFAERKVDQEKNYIFRINSPISTKWQFYSYVRPNYFEFFKIMVWTQSGPNFFGYLGLDLGLWYLPNKLFFGYFFWVFGFGSGSWGFTQEIISWVLTQIPKICLSLKSDTD